MTSIKNLLVRAKKKDKTRGRPSKMELEISKFLSNVAESPEFQSEIKQCLNDAVLYGTGIIDTKKFKRLRKDSK